MIVISIFKNRHMTRTALPTTYIRITIKWGKNVNFNCSILRFLRLFSSWRILRHQIPKNELFMKKMQPLITISLSAITDFVQKRSRAQVIDFPTPIFYAYKQLFIGNPKGSYHYMVYLEQMTNMAWLLICVFVLITPPFLFWASR